MRKSEAAKLPLASSCHEVQGDVGRDGFEFVPDFVGDKVPSSLIDEVFQTNNESKRSPSNEVEEGELIEGIEANDVSALLEQFLEYEEKQGSMDCSTSLVSLQSSLKDTSTKVKTISDKINLSVEAQQLDFDFPLDARSGGLPCLDVEISEHSPFTTNGENQEVHDLARSGSSPDYVEGLDESSKCDKKCQVDNHATDHNYACSGFPMRKPLTLEPEVNDDSIKQSILTCSPKASSSSDQEQKNEKNFCNGTENNHSLKRRLSCDENATDRKRILPKRYRGPYCEGSSDGDSSCDEERRYRYISTDEESDHKRMLSNKKSDYSSDEDRNYRKRSHRRHSLYSNDSCDGREYSSSDEESKNERTSRYDPRRSESDWHHKQSSGSNRESDHCRSQRNRRRRRSRSSDCSEKRNDIIKNRKFHDIELERKMEFKFDHHIRDTAKEERRIVYIGKISNKTTKDDVFRRFRPFGPIEKVTVHFREKGDNYAFVTFFEYSSAAEAIENLCFGGRRKFCGGSYVDFDSNTSYLEEQELSRPPSSDEMDFDALLRMSQKRIKTRKGSFKGR